MLMLNKYVLLLLYFSTFFPYHHSPSNQHNTVFFQEKNLAVFKADLKTLLRDLWGRISPSILCKLPPLKKKVHQKTLGIFPLSDWIGILHNKHNNDIYPIGDACH